MAARISQNQFARLIGVTHQAIVQATRRGDVPDDGGVDVDDPATIAYAEMITERRAERGHPPAPWADGERIPPPYGKAGRPRKDAPPTSRKVKPKPQTLAKRPKTTRAVATSPSQTPANDTAGKQAADAATPLPPLAPALAENPRPGNSPIGAKPESKANDRVVHLIDAGTREIKKAREAISLQRDKINYLVQLKKLMPAAWHYRSIGRIAAILNDHFRTFADRHSDQLEAMAKAGAERVQFYDYIDAEINKSMEAVQSTCDKEIQKWRDEETSATE